MRRGRAAGRAAAPTWAAARGVGGAAAAAGRAGAQVSRGRAGMALRPGAAGGGGGAVPPRPLPCAPRGPSSALGQRAGAPPSRGPLRPPSRRAPKGSGTRRPSRYTAGESGVRKSLPTVRGQEQGHPSLNLANWDTSAGGLGPGLYSFSPVPRLRTSVGSVPFSLLIGDPRPAPHPTVSFALFSPKLLWQQHAVCFSLL